MGLPKVGNTYKSSQFANFARESNPAYLFQKFPNPKPYIHNKHNRADNTNETKTR